MRFFFHSRQFKVILAVFLSVVLLSTVFAFIGKRMTPGADILGSLFAPVRSSAAAVGEAVGDFFTTQKEGNRLMLENARLTEELNELRKQVAENGELANENAFLKDYLGIKDSHPDFEFLPATLISRDNDDPYGSFVINKGSAKGISLHDPVITESGLIGYVTEVGLFSCKVTTILNPQLALGAVDSRTGDSGIVMGNLALSKDGMCQFANLSRSCSVAVGDYVVTSCEGIFPEGLLIGSIDEIGSNEYNTSIHASIKPFVDTKDISNVMVITHFEGQGGIEIGGKK